MSPARVGDGPLLFYSFWRRGKAGWCGCLVDCWTGNFNDLLLVLYYPDMAWARRTSMGVPSIPSPTVECPIKVPHLPRPSTCGSI